jgi:hypothetical protein
MPSDIPGRRFSGGHPGQRQQIASIGVRDPAKSGNQGPQKPLKLLINNELKEVARNSL